MTDIPGHDHADDWVPPRGWVDPRDDDELPWVQHPTDDDLADLDWLPPAERLAGEPLEVEAVDRGQQAAPELDDGPGDSGLRSRIPSAVGVNLTDYSRDPQARGFGAPCAQQMAVVQLTEARFLVHVALAELAGHIMRANEAQGYRYRKVDTGAYNCRHIGSNPNLPWSWHAWAAAIDENWQTNPMRLPLTTDRPRWEIDRWNRYGWAWGGDYSGTPDTMHNEFMGTAAQAAIATALARRELASTPTPTPTPTTEDDEMRLFRNAKGTVVLVAATWAEWVPTATDHARTRAQFGVEQTYSDDFFNRVIARARAAGTPPATAAARTLVRQVGPDGAELDDDPSTWPATPGAE